MNAINSKPIEEVMVGMSIGTQMRHWRKVKNITQKELAKKIGSNQPAIARFERDGYLPSLSFLIRVATALEKRVEVKLK